MIRLSERLMDVFPPLSWIITPALVLGVIGGVVGWVEWHTLFLGLAGVVVVTVPFTLLFMWQSWNMKRHPEWVPKDSR